MAYISVLANQPTVYIGGVVRGGSSIEEIALASFSNTVAAKSFYLKLRLGFSTSSMEYYKSCNSATTKYAITQIAVQKYAFGVRLIGALCVWLFLQVRAG